MSSDAPAGPITVVGGAGRTGKLVVERLLQLGTAVRVVSRHATRARDLARQGVALFDADIRTGAGLDAALADSAGVVFSVEPGTASAGLDRPETTVYQGVVHVLGAAANASRFVLVSQIYVTRQDHSMNDMGGLLEWRLRGEDAVRAADITHTVVRPSWLTGGGAGRAAVRLEQGDTGDGEVARADVAEACVQALLLDSAANTTFEIYNEKGAPQSTWDSLFTGLARDGVRERARRTGGTK